jgi:hypothetical protein
MCLIKDITRGLNQVLDYSFVSSVCITLYTCSSILALMSLINNGIKSKVYVYKSDVLLAVRTIMEKVNYKCLKFPLKSESTNFVIII